MVLDPGREELVVVLTSRAKERAPSLDVDDVRAIVGPAAQIYYVATGPLTRDLSGRLPDQRGPYNGSLRMWLPGVDADRDRRKHPDVFDPTGGYGTPVLQQLAYRLRDAYALRDIEPEVKPLAAYRSLRIVRLEDEAQMKLHDMQESLARAVEERDEASQRARDESEEAVKRARTERDQALGRARDAERRMRIAERDRSGTQVGKQDPEGALRVLILQRWLETLSEEERSRHPLARYVLSADFVRSADALSSLVRDRLGFVCAMIASDRVQELAALVRSPLPDESRPNPRQDGTFVWQCSLTRVDSQTPPAVRYLEHADGTISFTGMGSYRTPSARQGAARTA